MEIKYQLFVQDNLLIQKYIGLFCLEEFLSYNGYISKKLSSSSVKKVLLDFRDLRFIANNDKVPNDFRKNLNKVIENRRNINQNEHKNKEVKLVIWVEKPMPTVIAHLFVKNFSGSHYIYCSTASKAIEVLKIPFYQESLESIVENLENTFRST